MAIQTIRQLGDPVLRQKAKRVSRIDGVQRLIDDLVETLRATPNALGLAAPQIGVPLRVTVIEILDAELLVLVNPQVVKRVGEREVDEGCLSIPGYRATLTRAESVVVKARDRSGKPIRLKADELLAQALEHEIDHLDGVLYIDRLASPDKMVRVETGPVEQEEAAVVSSSSA